MPTPLRPPHGAGTKGQMPHTAEGVTFGGTVAAGATESESYTLDGPATVESLSVRHYPGQELDLAIDVLIRDKGSGSTRPVIQSGESSTFRGDDDTWDFDLSKPVPDDSELVVAVTNDNPNYSYDYRVNMGVDYRNGVSGAVMGLFS